MTRSTLRALAAIFAVQFFAWSGMFALWIYTTPVVLRWIAPGAAGDSPDYANALTAVGACFAVYATLAAVLNFAHPWAFARLGRGRVYVAALVLASAGIALVPRVTNLPGLLGAFALIGVGWSLIGTIPYALAGEIAPPGQERRIMNILGFSIVLPQATSALLFGLVTHNLFAGHMTATMDLGAESMLAAAGLAAMFRVGQNPSASLDTQAP